MRLALLDLNGDGSFTESDMQEFAGALLGANGQPAPTWDRHDLNGDGYSGTGTARFDLDRVGSLQYGLASYMTVQETYAGQTMTFDESALSDLQILCYYAYSALYTGDTAARDLAIGDACGAAPPVDPVYNEQDCLKNNPDHIGVFHQVCGVFSYAACCAGLHCVDPTPNDNYSSRWCE